MTVGRDERTASICLVTQELRGHTRGGIGAAVADLAGELHGAGWDVWILLVSATAPITAPSGCVPEGVRVLTTADPRFAAVPDAVPAWAFGHELTAIADRAARCVEHLAGTVPFDVIEFPDYQGLGAGALKRRRLLGGSLERSALVVRAHGTLTSCFGPDLTPVGTHENLLTDRLERYALRHADAVLVPSEPVAADYVRRYGIEPDRLVVSPPPFDPLPVKAPVARDRTRDRAHVVCIGKLQRLKGVVDLVRASILRFDAGDDFDLTLVGGDTYDVRAAGSLHAALARMVPERYAGRIRFAGHLERTGLVELVADADLLVFPNLVETFCLAAYEVLPSGAPALLSDIPAFDVVAEERVALGLLTTRFAAGDSDALAAALGASLPAAVAAGHRPPASVADLTRRAAAAYRGLAARRPSPTFVPARPLVSVLVPYYEMHEYLETTLRSILASTYAELDVVVVDDGSPSEIARTTFDRLAGTFGDPRVRFLRKPNGGLGSARNHALKRARGELVLPVDSDDLLRPEMVERMVTALGRAPELDAVSVFVHYFTDESTLAPIDYVVPYDLDPVLVTIENRAGTASTMFRRSVFERLHPYDEFVWAFEDWHLWWSMAQAGLRAEVIPEALFLYRRRPSSMFKELTPSSWARLVEHISSTHPELLAEHAVDVHQLLFSSFVAMRAALAEARRAPASDEALVALARSAIAEARALRESRSFALGQRLGWLRRWAARRRRRPLEVRLESLPGRTGSGEVWVAGVRDGHGVVHRLPTAGWEGPWEERRVERTWIERCMVGTAPGAVLRVATDLDALAVLLVRHPHAGAVAVTTTSGALAVELDLAEGADPANLVELVARRDGGIEQRSPSPILW